MNTSKRTKMVIHLSTENESGYLVDYAWTSENPDKINVILKNNIEEAYSAHKNSDIFNLLKQLKIPYTVEAWEYDEVVTFVNQNKIKSEQIKF